MALHIDFLGWGEYSLDYYLPSSFTKTVLDSYVEYYIKYKKLALASILVKNRLGMSIELH